MLTENFQFSQASLQDYSDCPRRFQLRYLKNLAWPAIEVAPVEEQEKRIQLGLDFHRMVQQHMTGIPDDVLEQVLVDGNLERWWRNYQVYRPYDMPGNHYPELTLTVPIVKHRLVAKYDLLVVEAGKRITILDWKTTQYIPRVSQLQKRMQTKIYRYVLVQAGVHLNEGEPIKPDEVEMIYWFPEYPESPARLPYSAEQFNADHRYLSHLINEITAEVSFRMTTDTRRCNYCRYRTYCGTSNHVGIIESYTDETAVDVQDNDIFDFEHIAEIEF